MITETLFQIIMYKTLKGFNVLIHGKMFFDLLVKNEEEVYKKIIKMCKSNGYTTGNLLNFWLFQKKKAN